MQVEFRDGMHEVPEWIAEVLQPNETFRLTYEEAVKQANARLLNDYVGRAQRSLVEQHFRNWQRE